jgi:tRNA pseudouridine38-40 synthase
MRYFIEFSYNGSHYHGWQAQPNAVSVQEVLTNAFQRILNSPIELVAAGRTDTGVHAKQMFAHFDIAEITEIQKTVSKLNSFLPEDIAIQNIFEVSNDGHARFSARKRTYEYHIHQQKNVFKTYQSWFLQKKIDVDLMNQAAQILFDHTDFESFSKTHTDVNTFECKIYKAHFVQTKNDIIFTITADRFLRNMVRSIVGTLINVGLYKITLEQFNQIILDKSRQKAGFSVPACGLYLTKIEYDFL